MTRTTLAPRLASSLALGLALSLGLAGGSAAASPLPGVLANLPEPTISLGISTLGVGTGVELHNPRDLLGLRGSVNLFHFGLNFKESDTTSNTQAKLQNESLLFDYYPFRTGFHLTGGVIFNQNSANFSSTPQLTGALLGFITQTHYTGAVGDVHGPISFNPVDPYFGVGYEFQLGHGFGVTTDIGAIYQGNGRITLNPSGLLLTVPQLRAGVLANAERADRMIDKMSFYPIISMSLSYKF
jgi:hypothetical protein